jgi:hypothetical protein
MEGRKERRRESERMLGRKEEMKTGIKKNEIERRKGDHLINNFYKD